MSVPTTVRGRHDGCGGAVVFRPVTHRRELLAGRTVTLTAACRSCGATLSTPWSLATAGGGGGSAAAPTAARTSVVRHGRALQARRVIQTAQERVLPMAAGAEGQTWTSSRTQEVEAPSWVDVDVDVHAGQAHPAEGAVTNIDDWRPREAAAPAGPAVTHAPQPAPVDEPADGRASTPVPFAAPAAPAPRRAPARRPMRPRGSDPLTERHLQQFAERIEQARSTLQRLHVDLPTTVSGGAGASTFRAPQLGRPAGSAPMRSLRDPVRFGPAPQTATPVAAQAAAQFTPQPAADASPPLAVPPMLTIPPMPGPVPHAEPPLTPDELPVLQPVVEEAGFALLPTVPSEFAPVSGTGEQLSEPPPTPTIPTLLNATETPALPAPVPAADATAAQELQDLLSAAIASRPMSEVVAEVVAEVDAEVAPAVPSMTQADTGVLPSSVLDAVSAVAGASGAVAATTADVFPAAAPAEQEMTLPEVAGPESIAGLWDDAPDGVAEGLPLTRPASLAMPTLSLPIPAAQAAAEVAPDVAAAPAATVIAEPQLPAVPAEQHLAGPTGFEPTSGFDWGDETEADADDVAPPRRGGRLGGLVRRRGSSTVALAVPEATATTPDATADATATPAASRRSSLTVAEIAVMLVLVAVVGVAGWKIVGSLNPSAGSDVANVAAVAATTTPQRPAPATPAAKKAAAAAAAKQAAAKKAAAAAAAKKAALQRAAATEEGEVQPPANQSSNGAADSTLAAPDEPNPFAQPQ